MSRKVSDDLRDPPHPHDWGEPVFTVVGFNHYRFAVPAATVTMDVSRLRRDGHELKGELTVRCEFATARTLKGGILSSGDWNLSSLRAHAERAKHLAARALTTDCDWEGWLMQFAAAVLEAERVGQPAELLADVVLPEDDGAEYHVHGVSLPRTDPLILFGDGGSAKSMLALSVAGELARAGTLVLYCDWETGPIQHRKRFGLLYPDGMPAVLYAPCDRPLVTEIDRLRALVVEHGIQYLILDSAAYGCQGAPEAAEAAIGYFRALKSLGRVGSLVVAHVTKSEEGDKRPFGSSFWHNSARSTYHIRRSNPDDDGPDIQVLLSQRKCNEGRLRPPFALSLSFAPDRIRIAPGIAAQTPEFERSLTLLQRVRAALRVQPKTPEALQAEFADEKSESVSRVVRRGIERDILVKLPNGAIGIKSAYEH